MTELEKLLNQLRGPSSVQVQPEVYAQQGIIDPMESINYEPAENYRQNVVRSIEGREALAGSMMDEIRKQKPQRDQDAEMFRAAVEEFSNRPQAQYKSNPEIDSRYQQAVSELDTIKAPAGRDALSEAIVSFGPAVLGMATGGQAGLESVLPAGRAARDQFEKQRKESIDSFAKAREGVLKKVMQLQKLKESDRAAFNKEQEAELKKSIQLLKSTGDIAKLSDKQLLDKTKEFNDLATGAASATEAGAAKYAQLAQEPERQEQRTKRARIISQQKDIKVGSDLRKEFSSLPQVKNFSDITESYEKIKATIKEPSAAGDISLVYSYMKMLDPGSVVRETEYATAQNAAGVPDRIRNIFNSLKNGERLTPKQREDFFSRAEDYYNAQQSLVSKLESQYEGIAREYGVNPKQVISRKSEPVKSESKQDQKEQIREVDGKKYKKVPGGWRRVDG